jgi:hypothetical protein
MDFAIIIQRLNELTARINTLISNSKKIIELPDVTDGAKWLAVWNETSLTTEKFSLTTLISAVFDLTNTILSRGSRNRVENVFTYSTGYQWRINGVTYLNENDVLIEVDPADEGFYRIDNIVLDTLGNIRIVIGTQTEDVAAPPDLEADTLLLDTIYIFGGEITTGTSPESPVFQKLFIYADPNPRQFALEVGQIAMNIYVNRAVLYGDQSQDTPEFTQSGNIITLDASVDLPDESQVYVTGVYGEITAGGEFADEFAEEFS